MTDVLPDSRLKFPKGEVFSDGVWWEPVFCAHCGARKGYVTKEFCDFAFFLCDPCAEKHGEILGTVMVPTAVFWQHFKEACLERYGRELKPPEVDRVLDNVNDPIAKLIRQGG